MPRKCRFPIRTLHLLSRVLEDAHLNRRFARAPGLGRASGETPGHGRRAAGCGLRAGRWRLVLRDGRRHRWRAEVFGEVRPQWVFWGISRSVPRLSPPPPGWGVGPGPGTTPPSARAAGESQRYSCLSHGCPGSRTLLPWLRAAAELILEWHLWACWSLAP